MDGVNEPDKNGKISNLLDPDAEQQTFYLFIFYLFIYFYLDGSRKTHQTSWTKMTFYSFYYYKWL
ncbi:hypothetical protein Hanom_Chr02g00171701 [Helianthus anomalus]